MKKIAPAFLIALLSGASAQAADIYVNIATGKNDNPGTKAAPLKLLERAVKAAQPGDTVHVAGGDYGTSGNGGCLPKIEKGNIAFLGGYTADFSKRDPHANPTTIISPPDALNKCRFPTFHVETSNNKIDNITIDGFVIDRGPLNIYKGEWGSQDNSKSPNGYPAISVIGQGGFKIRNNVILNSAYMGIYLKCAKDSEVHNNVIFGSVTRNIEAIAGSGWGKPVITVTNNTSLFSFKLRSSEGRGFYGDNIASYVIKNNIFAFNDQGGVEFKFANENVTLDNNLFYTNKYGDVVIGGQGGKRIPAASFSDDLEVTSAKSNVSADPKLNIDKKWMDLWLSRKDAAEGNLTMDGVNQLRSAMGLPLQGGAGKPADNYAVRYLNYKDLISWVGKHPQGVQKFN